jgi:hypothetical protein
MPTPSTLNADQIQLLIEASTANWKDVEPAIFGTLLERALDPRERHKLGAHYTPRAYVERLVNPTVIEPLREQWKSVQVAALQLAEDGQRRRRPSRSGAFLHELATIRVLDPACGSGNFLYVTLELLKRLEGEVLNTLHDLAPPASWNWTGVMVTPANFFGIELNPRAAAIAEQVLWIGFPAMAPAHARQPAQPARTHHQGPAQHRETRCRAGLRQQTEQRDADGEVVTRWDGRTTKPHPVTGEEVPDPDARVPCTRYTTRARPGPRRITSWGTRRSLEQRMRDALGDGYTEALRGVSTTCRIVRTS